MKYLPLFFITALIATSCDPAKTGSTTAAADTKIDTGLHIQGTWKLVSGETIDNGKSTPNVYPKDMEMIKILNADHFAFMDHHVNVAKDSSNHFDGGGGAYELKGDQYTEHLDFYSDKTVEHKAFTFTVTLKNDTLTQKGIEKNEAKGITRMVIERYVRLK